MKKYIISMVALISLISFSSFNDMLNEVDKLSQEKKYKEAENVLKKVNEKNLSIEEKIVYESIKLNIEDRIKNTDYEALKSEKINLDKVDEKIKEEKTPENPNVEKNKCTDIVCEEEEIIEEVIRVIPTSKNYNKNEVNKIDKLIIETLKEKTPENINKAAYIYLENGLIEKAMKMALSDRTGNIKNIYLAATSARLLGNYEKAIKLYNKVLEHNSSHQKSIDAIMYIEKILKLKDKNN